MESEKLIQLRSSGPGLMGPFLEESMAPYRVLDENSQTSFRILLVIGGKQKANFFGHHIIAKSISLWQLSDTCLVLDSELHHSDGGLPRILGGPTLGHHRYHLLNSDQETMCRMAYKLYSKVLSQFADLNMIFVQDMGGMAATVEFLSRWTLWADAHQERVPMVLVQDVPVSLEELHFEMTIQLLAMLRGQEPERQLSTMQIKSLITKTFCFYVASSPAQLPQLFDLADKRAQGQADRGLQLSAAHTKTLLQRGIAQFAKTPHQPLRFVHLSRKNCPVPVTIRKNVTSTILVNKNHPGEVCHIIASALALDALTAGGHCT
ncbi:hypothetical protein LEL_08975 [Akanthomyces lecanii RCEF 1005]|uniref:Uncharacterized protein n=1 Tax=Akanthomyces lecanii RCEF 1005 TaxID=1081108 RepID=A0A168CSL9_CORDF|nr:hypothetical protein LEL_08975 [Akanthomyces lecanii RCEF 1005]